MPKNGRLNYEEREHILLTFIQVMFQYGNDLDMKDAVEYMDKYWKHQLLV